MLGSWSSGELRFFVGGPHGIQRKGKSGCEHLQCWREPDIPWWGVPSRYQEQHPINLRLTAPSAAGTALTLRQPHLHL